MKLATKKDIEAPIAKVWAALSDYEAWERSAMRRGVDVERTDKLTSPGPGMSWTSRFAYRARTRKADMKLTEMTGPGLLAFTLSSDAVDVAAKVELIEMSARRTRMHLTSEVKPRSLGARLFLQSLRLARSKVDRKFDAKVGQLALELETRAKAVK